VLGTEREVECDSKTDEADDEAASSEDSPDDSVMVGEAKADLKGFFRNFIFLTLSEKRAWKLGDLCNGCSGGIGYQ